MSSAPTRGEPRMIAYLIRVRKHFEDVDRRLTETLGTTSLQQVGLTAEHVDSWYQEEVRRVEAGESEVPLSTIRENRDHLLRRITMPPA